jgi:hypothetical protein
MITFTIKRAGDFTVRTYGPNHCGTTDNLQVRYNLQVVCREGGLDEKGFLFDQTKVQEFFAAIKTTRLSCEEFCYSESRNLFKFILSANPRLKGRIAAFTLELSPAPFAASLTFTFVDDEAVSKAKPKPRAA